MQGRQESVLILPSSSTLSCSPSTHVWLNSSVCLEQKIQGKIKELLQMTLVSCMNTKTDSERQCTLRCHRFWWENAMAVVFFFTIMLQQQKYVLEVVTLYHKSTRERETRTCERGIHHTVLPDVLLSQTQVASGSFDHGHAVEMIMKQ